MKALNKQERNSAILRFSLWLLISVLIICVPVIFTAFLPYDQQSVTTVEKESLIKDKEDLIKVSEWERDYIATKVQEITDLQARKDAEEINPDVFNAELMSIFSDITNHSDADTSWRGDMYRNIVDISKFLIVANKIVSSSGEKKGKQVEELNAILLEMESCVDELAVLNDEKKKKDMSKGLANLQSDFKKVVKMLNNYKTGLE